MNRIEKLKSKVDGIYQSKKESRAEWADWLYENHIFIVADYARRIANQYNAKEELCVAASMLHDIADAVMDRENPQHEKESFKIAKEFLIECDFEEDEIEIIIDDAMNFHGCHGNETPQTLEGKIMATADALAHLKTDFYSYALNVLKDQESTDEIKNWALPKLDRDFNKKIFFDEVKEEARPYYDKLVRLFSKL